MKVELTMPEIMQAAQVGVMRRMQRLRSGIPLPHGLKEGSEWQLMIEGALSECALAKFLGIYWEGCGEINGVDVGEVDVRSTRYDSGKLIIHKSDASDRKYYLLTGKEGKYIVRGWIWGYEAKQDKYYKSMVEGRPPEYFVPQEDLYDIM